MYNIYIYFYRYNVRGSDNDGEVANFIETEQIVNFGEYKCSYVQVETVYIKFFKNFFNVLY